MNTIPTAEEVLNRYVTRNEWGDIVWTKGDVLDAMEEFAKLHVKAALEAACNKVTISPEWVMNDLGKEVEIYGKVDAKSILNAYPDTFIK